MSAMTRLRNDPVTECPRAVNAEYYAQRASKGGLLVTECAFVRRDGRGYLRAPGLETDEQAATWRPVTDAVHAKGGVMFAQLFHAGRITHPKLTGGDVVCASAVRARGQVYVGTSKGMKEDYGMPRELSTAEVEAMPAVFAAAAKRAVELGGFDGVEMHAGNGYLLQAFLARATNTRTDKYGGPIANRARLLLETIDAVAAAIGPSRTAVKIQPGVTAADLIEPEADVAETLDYLAPELSRRRLAYVCVSSLNGAQYSSVFGLPGPNVSWDLWTRFRQAGFKGTHMINGGLNVEEGERYVAEGVADLVSYGVPFIANANLRDLVAAGARTAGLNPGGYNTGVWYSLDPSNDAKGYTDWPLQDPAEAAAKAAA
ncbi:hypothetical protein HYH03_008615 [Edaphochlamys debaryana]|uniref:NADH:flavin oxidoreductase/NADH oxidase N-terminal domain-containing protein n=1 Tax=Edaphochlamys debaryana TaxID=47281 RepID=A0A836BY43_9CHLO|nr:hypothetical protein HYH03_008615 [Edaphochlamys debaryana]|eukprot:KAG2493195.1 hypothetical protein HYH03_008615 [Edaphochlamys debaryana]